jgi:3',5'-cyclic AMP phosphodiesterase CpdA
VPTRILHISDIHTGTAAEARLEETLPGIVGELDPDLVLFTGDITHRGKREQFARGSALLRSFDRPLVVIPGNHDIPAGACAGSRRRGASSTASGPSASRCTALTGSWSSA